MEESKRVWTKEETILLIELFKNFPILWDVKRNEYRDKNKKTEALKVLAQEFNTNINEISRKLHNLRSQFHSETRKIRKAMPGKKLKTLEAKWEFYDKLKFLGYKSTKTITNMEFCVESMPSDKEEEMIFNEDLVTDEKTEIILKRKSENHHIDEGEAINHVIPVLENPLDDDQTFGNFVASQLRSLKSEALKKKMKVKIQRAILDISEEALSKYQESRINFPHYNSLKPNTYSLLSSTSIDENTSSDLYADGLRKHIFSNIHSFYREQEVSKPAPQWEATAVIDGEFKHVKLSDYKGKYVVFFFYPLDFTFVCPTEILAFSDRVKEFHSLNAEVIACSVDSHFTHLAWTKTPRTEGGLGKLGIPLVSDITHTIAKAYGVYLEDQGVALRGLFIIDDKGILRQITMNDLPVGRSVDETLRLVQAFQFTDKHGEVCPAGWKPGDATIIPTPEESRKYFKKANKEL